MSHRIVIDMRTIGSFPLSLRSVAFSPSIRWIRLFAWNSKSALPGNANQGLHVIQILLQELFCRETRDCIRFLEASGERFHAGNVSRFFKLSRMHA
jgi:hypothetical protein